MPYVVGGNEVYQQQTSWPLVLEHTDVVVLWSANPLNTLKIAWNATDEQGIPYFDALRKAANALFASIRCALKPWISWVTAPNGLPRTWEPMWR